MIKAFKTAPATIVNTYTFTERDIRRPDGYRLVISRGKIVPDQFTAIHRMLWHQRVHQHSTQSGSHEGDRNS